MLEVGIVYEWLSRHVSFIDGFILNAKELAFPVKKDIEALFNVAFETHNISSVEVIHDITKAATIDLARQGYKPIAPEADALTTKLSGPVQINVKVIVEKFEK